MLNAHFQLVRGPELFGGVVGSNAKNVRDLFAPAEEDWYKFGTSSPLHVVVIDELDSLFPQRGTSRGLDGGASDQIVGQFLSMLDGVMQMNNLLIIGTTNRYELIDAALKRPGRLGHHFEIGMPSLEGRQAIWRIHTENLVANGIIEDTYLPTLAAHSEGFSGAHIVGCISDTVLEAQR